jgi:hypothetical protein
MPQFNQRPHVFAPAPPLYKTDREAQVARFKIKPQGNIVLQLEQRVVLAAISLDKDGNVIQGLMAEFGVSKKFRKKRYDMVGKICQGLPCH